MANENFIIYRFDTDLNIIDETIGTLEKVKMILEESLFNSYQLNEHGETSLAKTSFGLSKNEHDFIDIACNSASNITCHTDRLIYNSIFVKLLSYNNHFYIKTDKNEIWEIIKNYIRFDRKTFERTYKNFICR